MIEQSLKDIFEQNFPNSEIIVDNQSHLHEGHGGSPGTGESHFHVTIISDRFEGVGRVQRHQMVYGFISPLMDQGLHAISFVLKSPDEI